MLPPPSYFVLLSICLIYALFRGGLPERIGTTILIFGSALTNLQLRAWPDRYQSVEVGVAVIDALCLIAFVILALRSDRFWTIWVSAIMAVGALGHLARWYAGDAIAPLPYALVIAVGSYPMMALIAIGTWNHHRGAARMRREASGPKETG